jgi:hypothetical protein
MPAPPKSRRLPNLDNQLCFGCSSMNPKGLGMEFYATDDAIASWIVVGERGVVMEGVIYDHHGKRAARATGHIKLFSVETLRRREAMDDCNLLAIENLIQNL